MSTWCPQSPAVCGHEEADGGREEGRARGGRQAAAQRPTEGGLGATHGVGWRPWGGVASEPVDPSVIITPVVTLIGIGVGYAGGVQKGKADLRVERERTQQLRDERAEDHRQHRADAYHEVLNAGSKLEQLLREGGQRIPYINAKILELEAQVNGVLAFGAAPTHEPAQSMLSALKSFDHVSRDLTAYEAARQRFLVAAHADVGPESLT
jgi:hypothetical protein